MTASEGSRARAWLPHVRLTRGWSVAHSTLSLMLPSLCLGPRAQPHPVQGVPLCPRRDEPAGGASCLGAFPVALGCLLCSGLWLPVDWKHPELPASPALPPLLPGEPQEGLGLRAPPPGFGLCRVGSSPRLPCALLGVRHGCVHGTGVQRRPVHFQPHEGGSADPSVRGSVVSWVYFLSFWKYLTARCSWHTLHP